MERLKGLLNTMSSGETISIIYRYSMIDMENRTLKLKKDGDIFLPVIKKYSPIYGIHGVMNFLRNCIIEKSFIEEVE